jgi:hypothetical protein
MISQGLPAGGCFAIGLHIRFESVASLQFPQKPPMKHEKYRILSSCALSLFASPFSQMPLQVDALAVGAVCGLSGAGCASARLGERQSASIKFGRTEFLPACRRISKLQKTVGHFG